MRGSVLRKRHMRRKSRFSLPLAIHSILIVYNFSGAKLQTMAGAVIEGSKFTKLKK
jgi:hypothetical protein